MTIEEATNVTLEDAINTFERLVFSQDFSPSTLRGKAICKIALKALRAQRQENNPLTLEELRGMRGIGRGTSCKGLAKTAKNQRGRSKQHKAAGGVLHR